MKAVVAAMVLVGSASVAEGQQDTVRIQTIPVASGVYMLVGQGGNIGVSVGEDGVFLVDDQFAPLTGKIIDAVKAISDKPIRFLLNTHWHGDHTGGNENFGKAGVIIVAHDNVRQRMSVEQFIARFNSRTPPAPKPALPVVTFNDAATFHLNGEDIHAVHVKNAHTDGDVLVHWQKANVLHMGDTFFNGSYPFIDLSTGGSITGLIDATATGLAFADEQTRIIPGHGPLAAKSDMVAYRDMLVAVRDNVKQLIAAGKTLAQVLAAKPTAAFDAKWGNGFMKADDFVTTVFESLTAKK